MHHMEHIRTIVMFKICKHTFYAYLSRIWKMMQFTRFIRKVFATKILLSGKFLPFLTLISSWTGDLNSSLRRIGWLSLDGKDQNSSIFYHAALMCKPMKYDLYENRDKTCPDWIYKHQFLSVGIQERGVGLSLGAVSELYRETKDCPQERFLLKCKLNQESQFKQTCSLRKQSFRVVTNWLKIVPYWPTIGLQ